MTEREGSWYRELKLCHAVPIWSTVMRIETAAEVMLFLFNVFFPMYPMAARSRMLGMWTFNQKKSHTDIYLLPLPMVHGWLYFFNVSPIEMAIILRPSPIFSSKWNSSLGPRTFSGWWRNETRCDGALGLRFFAQWPDRSISDAHKQLSMTAWLL